VHLYMFKEKAEPVHSLSHIMNPMVMRRGDVKADKVPHSTDMLILCLYSVTMLRDDGYGCVCDELLVLWKRD